MGRGIKGEGLKVEGKCARKSRKVAFTLAEVLITLGIIGVVAAMTLPTLIQNHQKRSLEVATQKFYSTMSQAVKKYMADMQEKGLIERKNGKKNGEWIVNE